MGRKPIGESVPPYEDAEAAWWAFGPEGALLAQVFVPERLRPIRIGPEHVLGVALDPHPSE